MFDKKSGGGITLSNLFHGWDCNRIAVATDYVDNPDFSVCKNVYAIGDAEIERGFPFNFKTSPEGIISGKLDAVQVQQSFHSETVSKKEPGKLEKIKDYLITKTGQIHRRRRFVLSNEFSQWLSEFSPDIIYSQLSSLELIHFVAKVQQITNKPLVLHLMDDWPVSVTSEQMIIFKQYWSNLINNELIKLIKKADVLMSISESMSEEYLKRYKREFQPFHNPIDVKSWISAEQKEYSVSGAFRILYAGRIGSGLQNCLFDVASAINNLNSKGLNIEFQIQATMDNPILKKLAEFNCVKIKGVAPYNQLPDIFSAADLLLLPNDFDKNSVSFLKHSMPTKASEYMVSGTPVLVFSSSESAVTKHALKHKWAYVVSENSQEKLESAIRNLFEDEDLRIRIGTHAKAYAIKHFDGETVRTRFLKTLQNQH